MEPSVNKHACTPSINGLNLHNSSVASRNCCSCYAFGMPAKGKTCSAYVFRKVNHRLVLEGLGLYTYLARIVLSSIFRVAVCTRACLGIRVGAILVSFYDSHGLKLPNISIVNNLSLPVINTIQSISVFVNEYIKFVCLFVFYS